MTAVLTFNDALAAIRAGAGYSICGLTLTVNGIALAITGEQFDIAWDAMNDVQNLDENGDQLTAFSGGGFADGAPA